MKTIRFSHEYKKFPMLVGKADTTLLDVWVRSKNNISQPMIEYDTKYGDSGEFYTLPNTNLIILFLWTEGQLWTTMRRWTPDKERHYRTLIGQQVKIEVVEDKS